MEDQPTGQLTEHMSNQTVTSPPTSLPNNKGDKKSKKKSLLPVILAVVAAAGLAAAGYMWWLLMSANQNVTNLTSEKQTLQLKVDSLTNQLIAAQKAASGDDSSDPKTCDDTVTMELKDNIKAAVSSKNYAALEGYMAKKVSVIIAASEGVGERTPVQAVADLEYLDNGESPWNFNLSPATIALYQTGFYKPYFDSNTFVGRSDDKLVVAFDFDDCGDINEIFMAADESILTEN